MEQENKPAGETENTGVELSVIIPVYNMAGNILAVAQNAAAVNNGRVEIIFVDDGSTDNSYAIAERLAADNASMVRAYRLPAHMGQCAARNEGLRMAQGTYVCFLDADDRLLGGDIQQLLRKALEMKADVIHSAGCYADAEDMYIHLEGQTRLLPLQEFYTQQYSIMEGKPADNLRFFLQDGFSWSACTKLYRREFLMEHQILFREDVGLGEGLLFLLPCIVHAQCYVLAPQMFYWYLQTPDSLTRREKGMEDVADILRYQANGLQYVEEFFETQPELLEDASLKEKAKDFFLRPLDLEIGKISMKHPDMWNQLDAGAGGIFEDSVLKDPWRKNWLLQKHFLHLEEMQDLRSEKKSIQSYADAMNNLLDKTLRTPRVIVAASVYTLVLCTLLFRDWEKSIFICGGGIPKEVVKNMHNMGITCYDTEEGSLLVSPDILDALSRYTKRNGIPIYGNDDTPDAVYFMQQGFTVVEEGVGNYRYEAALANKQAIRITPDGQEYVPFGFSPLVKHVFLTGKEDIPEVMKEKAELFQPQKLWKKKTQREQARILELFSFPGKEIESAIRKGRNCLLLTEPYTLFGKCDEETEIALYREMIEPYGEERILIKPHHQDKRDYAKIFPGSITLPRFFPIDLAQWMGMKFKKVISTNSSAAIKLFPEKIVETRMDLAEKYGVA